MAEPLDKTEPVYDASDEYRPEPEPIPEPPAWQDGSFRIGIHTSIAGDIAGALDIASKLGANTLQIFSANPRMWPRGGTRIADADAARFRARRAELGLGPLVIHDNYLINLASPDRVMRARSIQAFHDELVRAVSLGADFLVAHPGCCMAFHHCSPGKKADCSGEAGCLGPAPICGGDYVLAIEGFCYDGCVKKTECQ